MTIQTDVFPELDCVKKFFPLGAETPRLIAKAQIDQYNDQGYLFPFDIFSAEEIAEVRAYFDDLLPKAMATEWNSYEVINWHKYCRGVYDLVTNSRILDYVQDLLGETLILHYSHFFAKLPGDSKRVSWHQDASLLAVDAEQGRFSLAGN